MIDFEVARDKLAGFETADEIAEFLRSENIHGFPNSATECPIAQWMSLQTKGPVFVLRHCMGNGVIPRSDGTIQQRVAITITINQAITHTEAMQAFTHNFDKGFYSDLKKRGAGWPALETLPPIIEGSEGWWQAT